MALTLKLTRNVLNTYIEWKAQVLHDLHESVPYLYDNTVGDGPYNAWLDPILTDEWQMIGWNNVSEMTKFGMPGVFTHGTFDTWTPGYLMFIAATHNGISRLYETFGNGGADTLERTLGPNDTARTWYKQNPPLPKAKWSQRNNNNYQQTGLLVSLNHFADNKNLFLKNFYLKSKRSILKPKTEGPAAYVFPGDDPRPGPQADLLRILQMQGCEISRATAPFTVTVPGKKRPARETTNDAAGGSGGRQPTARGRARRTQDEATADDKPPPPRRARSPPAPTSLRMDQPYSRIADTLLDYQYWAPDDPQRNPYDDTGWTFGELFNVKVVRVTDVEGARRADGAGQGRAHGAGRRQRHAAPSSRSTTTPTRRSRRCATASRTRTFDVAEEPFEAGGQKFNRGSFIIARRQRAAISSKAAAELGLKAVALAAAPSVKTHPAARRARRADAHLDQHAGRRLVAPGARSDRRPLHLHQHAGCRRRTRICDRKYDVILFPPVGRGAGQQIITGMPMYGNPAAVEDDRADAEHRQDRLDRRHAARASAGRGWRTCRSSCATAACSSPWTTRRTSRCSSASPPACRSRRPSASRSPARAALEGRRRREPDRLRLRREPVDLLVRRSDLRRQQHVRRARRPRRRRRDARRADGPRHAGRSRSAAGPPAVGSAAARTRASSLAGRADPRRAAAQRHQRHSAGAAAARGAALRRRARPARVGAARRRRRDRAAADGHRRARSTRDTSCSSRTTRSGAARRRAATSWCSTRS